MLLLILKWGGEHTQSGQQQAEELGRAFRIIYPGGEGEYASLPGSGFLRLHSTYRHDLKVYASDEGRVQMTAGAFTKVGCHYCCCCCCWEAISVESVDEEEGGGAVIFGVSWCQIGVREVTGFED